MRTYEETKPRKTFQIDMRSLDDKTWLLTGRGMVEV